ncbi:hypothetical protein V7056_18050 [Bacillus sp. JJ664]
MKRILLSIFGLFLVFSFTGCIGEDYDFSPPTVTLSSPTDTGSVKLKEAHIDWRGENGKRIEKETEDIIAFAKKQKPLTFQSGEQVDLLFDSEDFKVDSLNVSVWKDNEEVKGTTLKLSNHRSFYLPKEKGKYVIMVDLRTDRGEAQYVGNVTIQ